MGYSIAAPIKSAKAQAKMYAFLQEHMRSWSDITAGTDIAFNPDYDPTKYLCQTGTLDYDRGKCRIGFNYSCSSGFTPYVYGLLRFIALRVGRVRKFVGEYGINESVPYIVYDGYEGMPVLHRNQWEQHPDKRRDWCLVYGTGWSRQERPWERPNYPPESDWSEGIRAFLTETAKEMDLTDVLVKYELDRLSALWNSLGDL